MSDESYITASSMMCDTITICNAHHKPWQERPKKGDTVYRESNGVITYGRAVGDGVPFGRVSEVKDIEGGDFVVMWVFYE